MLKLKLFIVSLFLLSSFQFVQAQQKTAKRVPLFENLQNPQYDGVVVWCKEFNVMSSSRRNIVTLPASTRQKMKAPANVKRLTGPVQMQCENKCLKIFGDIDILLLWHDANKDGKLNPKTELKCFKEGGKGRCKIKSTELNCK